MPMASGVDAPDLARGANSTDAFYTTDAFTSLTITLALAAYVGVSLTMYASSTAFAFFFIPTHRFKDFACARAAPSGCPSSSG